MQCELENIVQFHWSLDRPFLYRLIFFIAALAGGVKRATSITGRVTIVGVLKLRIWIRAL
jgi:hypothetical protein